ncbi:hypothetical protein AALB39_03995 [Lachnospiraceae bacterium 54-53]
MYEEMEEEYQQFLHDMEEAENALVSARYMDECDYEDNYGNNEICEYQEEFAEKVEDWLREHKPGKYMVSRGWCIKIMTPEAARERNISESSIEDMIVR